MAEPSVAAGVARSLIEFAASRGASRTALRELSGIDARLLEDQDNRVPLASYRALMRAGKELCGDPALALHYGDAVDLSEMSVVGLILSSCETMTDAFAQLNRYGRLVIELDASTTDRLTLEQSPGELRIIDARPDPNEFPELTESGFARTVSMARRYAGDEQFLKAVHFTHRAPAYRSEYDRIFRAPVVFESDSNALISTDVWLSRRPPHASRYAFGILSRHAESLLESLENSRTTRGRVESLLIPVIHTGSATMETVAAKLNVSRQTLFRKLKTEGTTFERILDDLRHKLALHYLAEKKASVNETAYLLGFSESAAFSRAFKRWTGSSPRQYTAGPG